VKDLKEIYNQLPVCNFKPLNKHQFLSSVLWIKACHKS